jgi:hypothetical protein
MANTNVLEDLAPVEEVAADLGKNPATLRRWSRRPNGLPFVRIGRKVYLHVPTMRAWLLGNMHKPNPTERRRPARPRKVSSP